MTVTNFRDPEPFSAVILAGGLGKRLGREKATAPAAGRPLLYWTAELMAQTSDDLVVVRRIGQTLPPPPDGLSWREVEDRRADAGPLAGIEAALHATQHDLAVIVACDMPLLEPALLRAVAAYCAAYDVAAPLLDSKVQPLLAAYRRKALPVIKATLDAGERRIRAILPELRSRRLARADLERFDPELRSFTNVNRPADLERVSEALRRVGTASFGAEG